MNEAHVIRQAAALDGLEPVSQRFRRCDESTQIPSFRNCAKTTPVNERGRRRMAVLQRENFTITHISLRPKFSRCPLARPYRPNRIHRPSATLYCLSRRPAE